MRNGKWQHIGDEQRVHGLPKHMAGVSSRGARHAPVRQSRQGGMADDRQAFYWTVHPKPDACKACKAMANMQYLKEPQRPHPNCQCEIRKNPIPVVSIYDTLEGYDAYKTHTFEGGQKISVTVGNMAFGCPGVWITVDACERAGSGHLCVSKVYTHSLTKLSEYPVPWTVTLHSRGGDNVSLQYAIEG
ncbi:MAG: hypothetical protein AB7E47_09970 [Desulfovibrionaceae bacterium]